MAGSRQSTDTRNSNPRCCGIPGKRAFDDFGMMKKGAIGLELTKLLRVAKECIEKQEYKE